MTRDRAVIGVLVTLLLAAGAWVWKLSAALEGMRKDVESVSEEQAEHSHQPLWEALADLREKSTPTEVLERLARLEAKMDMMLARQTP